MWGPCRQPPQAGRGHRVATRRARERGKPAKTSKRRVRRGSMTGWVVPDSELRASPPPRPSGNLRVYSINYKEELQTNIYNPDGSYSVEAAKQIAHVFRCRRTGEEHEIDPRLLTILSHVNDHFGGRPMELLSGYRFQRKTTSNHFHGTAPTSALQACACATCRTLCTAWTPAAWGSVCIRGWGSSTWTCARRPASAGLITRAPTPTLGEKQPPRGWKRRKLES